MTKKKERYYRLSLLSILILPVALLLFVVGGFFLFFSHPKPAILQEQSSFAALRSLYISLIKSEGPSQAYIRFKQMNSKVSQNLQHANAHIFGEVLYQIIGLQGAAICDTSFSFGCYHSFFGKAISENGISVVKRLDTECAKLASVNDRIGCSHGLGHGIAYYLGDKKLVNSLEICDKLSLGSRIGSCVSGVIMEYNLHTVNNPESNQQTIRQISNTDPLEPCKSLPTKFHQACYYEMPEWWNISYGFGESSQVIGDLCQRITDHMEQSTCFRGAGNIAAPTKNYNAKETDNFCQQLGVSMGTRACLESAILSFKSLPDTQSGISYLCAQLNDPTYTDCQ